MFAVPLATPDTTPDALTVAKAMLLLLQVPPVVVLLNVVVDPAQTVIVPVIAGGAEMTVIVFATAQPVDNI